MLYLSLYFKTHRQHYYELLNNVRMTGDWEAWLDFFAEAVIVTATQAVETAQQLLDLSNQDRDKISGLGRAAASTLQVHRALMEHPIATSGSLVEKTGITPATVNKVLGHLEQLGIVKELTAQKRNRLFSYAGYIEIMSRGTELPGQVGQFDPVFGIESDSLGACSWYPLALQIQHHRPEFGNQGRKVASSAGTWGVTRLPI